MPLLSKISPEENKTKPEAAARRVTEGLPRGQSHALQTRNRDFSVKVQRVPFSLAISSKAQGHFLENIP